MVLGGGLMLADRDYGCLLSLLSICYYAFVYVNPVFQASSVFLTPTEKTWSLLLRFLPVVAGILLAISRGKAVEEGSEQLQRYERREVTHRRSIKQM